MPVQQLNHKQKVLTIIFSLELWRANKQNIHVSMLQLLQRDENWQWLVNGSYLKWNGL